MSLRSHLAGALDPVRLAKQLGMKCDPWQARALRSTATRVLLNIHRQGGKTTTTAVLTTHQVVYRPGSLVLIVSPTQRQSTELFRKVLAFYRTLGRPVEAEAENMLSLVLENGSRVISVPGSEAGIRGYSADLVIVDEAARVSDEVYEAVSPMLAVTGGRLIAMSTPAGRRGWFYEASLSARWERLTIPATECPRITAEFLEEERATLGEHAFRQEYLCEFVDAAGAAFTGEDIEAMFEGTAPRRQAEPAKKETPRRLTDPELADLEQRRYLETVNRRRDSHQIDRKRRQRVCEHRWRTLPDGPTYCVWCEQRKEEAC